jgi:tetratricopeptide (TPR) repeat protein
MFGWILGTTVDANAWLRRALDVPGEGPEPAKTIANAMYLINSALWSGGADWVAFLAEFRETVTAVNVHSGHPVLALFEPMFAVFSDDVELGIKVVDERLDHPDPWTRAALWMVRGMLRENDGDMAGTREDMTNAVNGFRAIGDRFGLSQSLSSLADAHLVFGDHERAVGALEEAIALRLELQADDDVSHDRLVLAGARSHNGDREGARAEYEDIAKAGRGVLSEHGTAFAHLALGDLDRLAGDLAGAERHYAVSSEVLDEWTIIAPQLRALVYASSAFLAVVRDDLATACAMLEEATAHALNAKDMPVLAKVGVAVAAVREHRGDLAGAALALGVAERLRGAPDPLNHDVARLTASLRGAMGGAAYDAAHAEGLALIRADAIDQVRRR